MSSLNYTAGARTRNVVNIAAPGSTSEKAYSLTAPNSIPSSTADGFKNLHSQQTLHMMVHNNGLVDAAGADMKVSGSDVHVYGYNSSLGGATSWTELRLVDRTHSGNTIQFPPVTIPDDILHDKNYRIIVPIEGVERIAVHVETLTGVTAGTLDIYLGVNTI